MPTKRSKTSSFRIFLFAVAATISAAGIAGQGDRRPQSDDVVASILARLEGKKSLSGRMQVEGNAYVNENCFVDVLIEDSSFGWGPNLSVTVWKNSQKRAHFSYLSRLSKIHEESTEDSLKLTVVDSGGDRDYWWHDESVLELKLDEDGGLAAIRVKGIGKPVQDLTCGNLLDR